jgi:hypothetical protein
MQAGLRWKKLRWWALIGSVSQVERVVTPQPEQAKRLPRRRRCECRVGAPRHRSRYG